MLRKLWNESLLKSTKAHNFKYLSIFNRPFYFNSFTTREERLFEEMRDKIFTALEFKVASKHTLLAQNTLYFL